IFLQFPVDINQQVAAGDEVETRKWRVAQQVVQREHHVITYCVCDSIAIAFRTEVLFQPLLRYVSGASPRIATIPRCRKCGVVHVRCEDYQVALDAKTLKRLTE